MSRPRGFLIILGVLLIAGGAAGVYRYAVQREISHFPARCRAARGAQDWKQLETLGRRWSEWEPTTADAWLFRAEAAEGDKKYRLAADFLQRVPETDSKWLPAQVGRAQLLMGPANRPLEGAEVCQTILAREPRVADAHKWLIQFYALTLQRAKLVQQIDRAIEYQREPPEAFVFLFLIDTLRLANGDELNSRWLEGQPDEELFLVARALHMVDPTGRPNDEPAESVAGTEASPREQLLGDLLERFPHNVELLAHHIEHAMADGELDRVESLLAAATTETERDNRFWRYRGWVAVTQGNVEEGIGDYRKSLELNPLDWPTRNRLAAALRLQGDLQAADEMQRLVEEARSLRSDIRALPQIEAINRVVLNKMRSYAAHCGAARVVQALDDALNRSNDL